MRLWRCLCGNHALAHTTPKLFFAAISVHFPPSLRWNNSHKPYVLPPTRWNVKLGCWNYVLPRLFHLETNSWRQSDKQQPVTFMLLFLRCCWFVAEDTGPITCQMHVTHFSALFSELLISGPILGNYAMASMFQQVRRTINEVQWTFSCQNFFFFWTCKLNLRSPCIHNVIAADRSNPMGRVVTMSTTIWLIIFAKLIYISSLSKKDWVALILATPASFALPVVNPPIHPYFANQWEQVI
jgi:hypothetical protein